MARYLARWRVAAKWPRARRGSGPGPKPRDSVDVLFVDEAAQMSLANVLAISHAAPSLVLLGDPQQLDQPTQGTHPDDTEVSALGHLLAGRQTISVSQGLFLEETWRLHPDICDFTSEVFYEGKLSSRPGLGNQTVVSAGPVTGTRPAFLAGVPPWKPQLLRGGGGPGGYLGP